MKKAEKLVAYRRTISDLVTSAALETENSPYISDASFNAIRLAVSDYNLIDPVYDYDNSAGEATND